jgi:hypothetical protein
MNYRQYKRLTASPNAFRRNELERSVELLRGRKANLVETLLACLEAEPIPRPEGHTDLSSASDWFQIAVSVSMASEISEALLDVEASALTADGMTTPLASEAGSLVDRWSRLVRGHR